MKFMFFITTLTSLSGAPTALAADAVCESRIIKSENLNERGIEIQLPDSSIIQIIGHDHGDRKTQHQVLDILSESTLTDADAAKKTKALIANQQKAIDHFKADLSYLRSYVKNNPNAIVWAEATQQGLNAITPRFQQTYGLRMRNKQQLENQLIFASLSPGIYAQSAGELPRSVQLLGVEFRTLEIASLEQRALELSSLAKEAEKGTSHLKMPEDVLAQIKPVITKWTEALNAGDAEYFRTFNSDVLSEIVRGSNLPQNLKKALEYQLAAELLNYQAYALRNEQNAYRLMSSRNSGVLFIGESHVRPILESLKKKCRALLYPAHRNTAPYGFQGFQ